VRQWTGWGGRQGVFDKILFYSVISSYRTKWELSIIKKTRTVSGRVKEDPHCFR